MSQCDHAMGSIGSVVAVGHKQSRNNRPLKVTRLESPASMGKTRVGLYPLGNFSSSNMLLVKWFRHPDFSNCWSCGLDPALTLLLAHHQSCDRYS